MKISDNMDERRAGFSLTTSSQNYQPVNLVSGCKFCNTFPVFVPIYRWRIISKNNQSSKCHSYLSVQELNGGLNYILFNIQGVKFVRERQSLMLNINTKSTIIQKLNQFLDNTFVPPIRVGGLLTKTDLSYEVKHPILLLADHPAVVRILRLNLHVGAHALSAFVPRLF